MQQREAVEFHLYVLPWLIGFLGLTLGPLLYSLVLAFTDAELFQQWRFIGLANFREMFLEDPLFWKALANTAYYAFVSVPLSLAIAFGLAALLNMKLRGMPLFRTIFYLPSVTSGVAVVLLWGWIFNPSFGLLNYVLSWVDIQGPQWLGDPNWAMPAIIMMNLWNVGAPMIIFLAALQDVPQELYESADIDGAGWWAKVTRITLPMVSPVVFFNLVLGLIGAFQVFMQAYVLTGGGPLDATYVYLLHLYNNAFRYGRMGYASALAWVLFVVILALTSVIWATSRRWVFYAGEGRR
ncbi:carbohydrate ABC transporter permease [Geochorda subterranea]|uniref:Sugar ABC transporter permease n=1 Tax=Geochorda subterranea TaxID=3109564 RepID=A0ABZ1BQN7_9FIRM|nr:sugar ABC transporter permease [Limnochorda sp. LNt]WRP14963.1 sugar ABC transporter permease [Limnochorda sp. LNt]